MSTPTFGTRLVATAALVFGALTVLAPVAYADSGFRGSPDAIDRAVAAQEAKKTTALDARERSMLTRPDPGGQAAAPGAFERALITHANALNSQAAARLDARERSMATRPPLASTSLDVTRFGWGHFALGAGVATTLMLVLAGIGAFALRRGHDRVSTA